MALFGFAPTSTPPGKKILTARNKVQLAMVMVDPRIEAIERARSARGVSHQLLCRRARMHLSTWYSLRTGQQQPRPSTVQRLEAALHVMPTRPAPLMALTRAIEMLIADAFIADPQMLTFVTYHRPNRSAPPAEPSRPRLRTLAIYVLVVELALRAADVARALGIARSTIADARKRTEELIDNDPRAGSMLDLIVRRLGNEGEDA